MALFNKTKAVLPFKSLGDGGTTDMWAQSSNEDKEYYYNQEDLPVKPLNVEIGGVDLTEGTLGSLKYKEWGWGDKDNLEKFVLYVRLDPDVWAASTAYSIGDTVKSTAGDFYECSVAGDSGASEPTWDTAVGNTTTENIPPDWAASTAYSLGDKIKSTAGDYYECTTAGTSDSSEPTWDTVIGNTTADGTVTWTRIENISLTWIRIENIAADPDSLDADVLKCSELKEVFQATAAKETIALSIIIANVDEVDANVILLLTDSADNPLFTMMITILHTDGPLTIPEKIVVPAQGKVKILANRELVSVSVTEDES